MAGTSDDSNSTQYQSTTEANSNFWLTTARSVPLKMSIIRVLKYNDLVEFAVLPRSSVVAYREEIKLLFLRGQHVLCSGRRREAWVKVFCFLVVCFLLHCVALTHINRSSQCYWKAVYGVRIWATNVSSTFPVENLRGRFAVPVVRCFFQLITRSSFFFVTM